MKKEKSAGAIVFKKDKEIEYLLLNYEAGHWDFLPFCLSLISHS